MVTVLGRKVGLRQLETKLKRDWEKKGSIKIIDVPRDYYQVLFTSEEGYNNAFLHGPWIIFDHFIFWFLACLFLCLSVIYNKDWKRKFVHCLKEDF